MNFFNILSNILTKSDADLPTKPGFNSAFSVYMLIRYLRMDNALVPYSLIIQEMFNAEIDALAIYEWAFNNIPKRRSGFIKYIKPTKTNKDKAESSSIDSL